MLGATTIHFVRQSYKSMKQRQISKGDEEASSGASVCVYKCVIVSTQVHYVPSIQARKSLHCFGFCCGGHITVM